MSSGHDCLSQLAVERYLLGEMTPAEQSRVETVVEHCERCAAAIDETRADSEAFTMRAVPDGIRKLWTEPEPGFRWPRILAIAVPVAAVIAAVVMPGYIGGDQVVTDIPGIGDRAGDDEVQTKDGADSGSVGPPPASLGFYVLRDGKRVLGRPGESLTEGDRIQFWYEVPKPTAGVVVGIDGRGVVTRYFPETEGAPAPLAQGKENKIQSNVILDDSVGVERFYLCTAKAADVESAEVERAARQLVESGADLQKATRLPVECDQASVWIRKE
ncbi:MAG: hypothetical protein JRF63_08830 [Deltaproteobacteria bacterium]|nr:hypothetical protein [Deltaproteobacteria bacterium]